MLETEVSHFRMSPSRLEACDAKRYYRGEHDVLRRAKTAIGKNGETVRLDLPCARIVNNQYGRIIDQKVNYSLGRALTVDTENTDFADELKKYFGKKGQTTWRRAATEALNCGVAWLHPYIDESGELKLRLFDSTMCLPFWSDAEHTKLDALVRICPSETYIGKKLERSERVFVYTKDGVEEFSCSRGRLHLVDKRPYHFRGADGKPRKWDKIPIIPLKYNVDGIPMIRRAKSLQDALNELQSAFCDAMAENCRNTVLVLKNFDGEDLGEFRHNLATYGAVKVRSDSNGDGGVEKLSVDVNADNYESLTSQLTEALIECCRGFDSHDSRLSGNPNRMNVLSIYSDIDLDANGFENELAFAFDEWMGFIRSYLFYTGKGDYRRIKADVIINRDLLVNESSVIDSLASSAGILSSRTLIAAHPMVNDVEKEMERLGIPETDEQKGTN